MMEIWMAGHLESEGSGSRWRWSMYIVQVYGIFKEQKYYLGDFYKEIFFYK